MNRTTAIALLLALVACDEGTTDTTVASTTGTPPVTTSTTTAPTVLTTTMTEPSPCVDPSGRCGTSVGHR